MLFMLFSFSIIPVFAQNTNYDVNVSNTTTNVPLNNAPSATVSQKSDLTYVPLEPSAFAGFNQAQKSGNTLVDFLTNVFNFGIAAAIALALIMIIWGGIEYMTTDSWNGKEDGKTKIQDALYGLGLALVSYLILYTINPCLVVFTRGSGCAATNTFLYSSTTTPQTNDIGATPNNNGRLSDADARGQLANDGIYAISSGECTSQNNSTCTSLEGLPSSAINGLIAAQNVCKESSTAGCITVTGATEAGHSTSYDNGHGIGNATVDISYNTAAVNALSAGHLTNAMDFNNRNTYICESNNQPITCSSCNAYTGTNNQCHIHVQFNN